MIWPRWAIALAVGLGTVIITLAVLWLLEAQSAPGETCMDAEMREHIRALAVQGYDEGLKNHAVQLFSIYVRNPDEQPNRAQVGTQNSIRAYVRARELAAKWNPPTCP